MNTGTPVISVAAVDEAAAGGGASRLLSRLDRSDDACAVAARFGVGAVAAANCAAVNVCVCANDCERDSDDGGGSSHDTLRPLLDPGREILPRFSSPNCCVAPAPASIPPDAANKIRARLRGDMVDTRTNGSPTAAPLLPLLLILAVDDGRCNGAMGDGIIVPDSDGVGVDAGLKPVVAGRRCVTVNGASSCFSSSSKSGSKSVATCTGSWEICEKVDSIDGNGGRPDAEVVS